jgi:formylglycine-generating enzyme required for sulfatase activity
MNIKELDIDYDQDVDIIRTSRGGSWRHSALLAHAGNLNRFHPGFNDLVLGFRLVLKGSA